MTYHLSNIWLGVILWTQTQCMIPSHKFLISRGVVKVHPYSSIGMATFDRENEVGLKGCDTFILFTCCLIFLILLTSMCMDDALSLPFFSLHSISRPFSASVSLIMGKVKIPQKSISGQNLSSDRYEPPNLTDWGSSWGDTNNAPPWIACYQPQQARSLGTTIRPLEPLC